MSEFDELREILDVDEDEIYEGMPLGKFFIFLAQRLVELEQAHDALDQQLNSINRGIWKYLPADLEKRLLQLEKGKPKSHPHWLDMPR